MSTAMPPGGPPPQRPQQPGPTPPGFPPAYPGQPQRPSGQPAGGFGQPPGQPGQPGHAGRPVQPGQPGQFGPPGPPGPYGWPGPEAGDKPHGRKGLVAAVIVLSVLVLALGGTAAYLWLTMAGGGGQDPVTLPASLSGFNTLTGNDASLVRDRTLQSYDAAYDAAADIREYAKGSGEEKQTLTVLALRDDLKRPVIWAVRDDPDRSRVSEPKPGIWCVEYRVSKDSEYETTYCVKPTPELSVTTSFYSSKKKVTPAELSGITDQAWTAAKSS